jgi:hypothetical protein
MPPDARHNVQSELECCLFLMGSLVGHAAEGPTTSDVNSRIGGYERCQKECKFWLAVSVTLVLLQSSCSDATGRGNQANDRISIINNWNQLAARVTYYPDSIIPIDGSGVGYPSLAPLMSRQPVLSQAAGALVTLHLVAEVAPPSVGGQALQATSVSIVGNLAVVSYNMRGAQYLGAIDVFDISKEHKPELKSYAVFQNADINAVSTNGVNVFAAEATDDATFGSPAVAELMSLQGSNLVLNGNARRELSSFAATSMAVAGSRAYATSGDGGSLFTFDLPSFTPTATSISLHDARWVAVAGGKVVVVQGTPGQIAVFDQTSLAPLGTFPFTGADVAESKSTVELAGGKAFIAAGSGGVQVLSATTGAVVGSVARPDPASLGLDPSVVVTNAASVDNNLLFISNGEAGVYLAQGSQAFSATGSEAAQQITMLGRLQFGNLQSVNHVAYKSEHLFIAAGLGGIKIVKVTGL